MSVRDQKTHVFFLQKTRQHTAYIGKVKKTHKTLFGKQGKYFQQSRWWKVKVIQCLFLRCANVHAIGKTKIELSYRLTAIVRINCKHCDDSCNESQYIRRHRHDHKKHNARNPFWTADLVGHGRYSAFLLINRIQHNEARRFGFYDLLVPGQPGTNRLQVRRKRRIREVVWSVVFCLLHLFPWSVYGFGNCPYGTIKKWHHSLDFSGLIQNWWPQKIRNSPLFLSATTPPQNCAENHQPMATFLILCFVLPPPKRRNKANTWPPNRRSMPWNRTICKW